MPVSLNSRERAWLKARAQRLNPVVRIGKAGLSEPVLKSVDQALAGQELIKVKFDEFKEQRHELAPLLAAKTASLLIAQIGHIAVLYRKREGQTMNSKPDSE